MRALLQVAVVGAGRMGRRHAENVAASGRARVGWIVDPDPAAAAFAAALGAAWAPDYSPLAQADAVVVACPTALHPEAVAAALAAGRDVFCEKPLALGGEATRNLARRIAASGRYFQIGFMRRYDPAYAAAWREVRAGSLGRLRHLWTISRDPQPPPESYVRVSGGIFLDLGIHDIDILRWLAGDEIVEVHAQGNVGDTSFLARYDDVEEAQALVRFSGGATGTMLLSRSSLYGYDVRAELWGTAASLRVGYLQDPAVVRGDRSGLHARAVPGFLERFAEAYRREMDDFLCRVAEGRPSPATETDAVAAAEVADACQRALREGRPQTVAVP
jgi:predicted dehydrogenase